MVINISSRYQVLYYLELLIFVPTTCNVSSYSLTTLDLEVLLLQTV